jgi:tetratricopeptide (TPR) repeat protein
VADAGRLKTWEMRVRTAFDSFGRRARIRLSQLYLNDDIGRATEVVPLLQGSDERYASSPESIAQFWSFRVAALRKQGKLDEAISLLDALIKRDPDSKAIAQAAGDLAIALDQRADDLRVKEKKPKDADEMQRKAATFYAIAGRALLKADTVKVSAVEQTANRLFTLGLIANDVPETQQNFVGWDATKNKETANWTLAAELLTKALDIQPGYKMEVTLGRTHGFLGDYEKAAAVLGSLFDREQVYDTAKKALNMKAVRAKPELLYAYFEWGVAEHLVAAKSQDTDRFRRAQVILSTMTRNLDANTANWWRAKYYEAANLYAAGNYTDACFLMNDLDRTTSGFGKEFGLDADFAKLKDLVKDKCK